MAGGGAEESPADGWSVSVLFLGFLLITVGWDTLLGLIQFVSSVLNSASAALWIHRIKEEVLGVGVISLVLIFVEPQLSQICIGQKTGEVEAAEDVPASPIRAAEEGEKACPEGQTHVFPHTSIVTAHYLLFFVAVIHILQSYACFCCTIYRFGSWNSWELKARAEAADGADVQLFRTESVGQMRKSRPMLYWVFFFIRNASGGINEFSYGRLRRLFVFRARLHAMPQHFVSTLHFTSLCEQAMEGELATLHSHTWLQTVFMAIFTLFPDKDFHMVWITGLCMMLQLAITLRMQAIVRKAVKIIDAGDLDLQSFSEHLSPGAAPHVPATLLNSQKASEDLHRTASMDHPRTSDPRGSLDLGGNPIARKRTTAKAQPGAHVHPSSLSERSRLQLRARSTFVQHRPSMHSQKSGRMQADDVIAEGHEPAASSDDGAAAAASATGQQPSKSNVDSHTKSKKDTGTAAGREASEGNAIADADGRNGSSNSKGPGPVAEAYTGADEEDELLEAQVQADAEDHVADVAEEQLETLDKEVEVHGEVLTDMVEEQADLEGGEWEEENEVGDITVAVDTRAPSLDTTSGAALNAALRSQRQAANIISGAGSLGSAGLSTEMSTASSGPGEGGAFAKVAGGGSAAAAATATAQASSSGWEGAQPGLGQAGIQSAGSSQTEGGVPLRSSLKSSGSSQPLHGILKAAGSLEASPNKEGQHLVFADTVVKVDEDGTAAPAEQPVHSPVQSLVHSPGRHGVRLRSALDLRSTSSVTRHHPPRIAPLARIAAAHRHTDTISEGSEASTSAIGRSTSATTPDPSQLAHLQSRKGSRMQRRPPPLVIPNSGSASGANPAQEGLTRSLTPPLKSSLRVGSRIGNASHLQIFASSRRPVSFLQPSTASLNGGAAANQRAKTEFGLSRSSPFTQTTQPMSGRAASARFPLNVENHLAGADSTDRALHNGDLHGMRKVRSMQHGSSLSRSTAMGTRQSSLQSGVDRTSPSLRDDYKGNTWRTEQGYEQEGEKTAPPAADDHHKSFFTSFSAPWGRSKSHGHTHHTQRGKHNWNMLSISAGAVASVRGLLHGSRHPGNRSDSSNGSDTSDGADSSDEDGEGRASWPDMGGDSIGGGRNHSLAVLSDPAKAQRHRRQLKKLMKGLFWFKSPLMLILLNQLVFVENGIALTLSFFYLVNYEATLLGKSGTNKIWGPLLGVNLLFMVYIGWVTVPLYVLMTSACTKSPQLLYNSVKQQKRAREQERHGISGLLSDFLTRKLRRHHHRVVHAANESVEQNQAANVVNHFALQLAAHAGVVLVHHQEKNTASLLRLLSPIFAEFATLWHQKALEDFEAAPKLGQVGRSWIEAAPQAGAPGWEQHKSLMHWRNTKGDRASPLGGFDSKYSAKSQAGADGQQQQLPASPDHAKASEGKPVSWFAALSPKRGAFKGALLRAFGSGSSKEGLGLPISQPSQNGAAAGGGSINEASSHSNANGSNSNSARGSAASNGGGGGHIIVDMPPHLATASAPPGPVKGKISAHGSSNSLVSHSVGSSSAQEGSMQESEEGYLLKADLTPVRVAFDAIDVDKSGEITRDELYTRLHVLGTHTTATELDSMLYELDQDGDGHSIDLREFTFFIVFTYFGGRKGVVDPVSLRTALMPLGLDYSRDELLRMIRLADPDGDRKVGLRQFSRVFADVNLPEAGEQSEVQQAKSRVRRKAAMRAAMRAQKAAAQAAAASHAAAAAAGLAMQGAT